MRPTSQIVLALVFVLSGSLTPTQSQAAPRQLVVTLGNFTSTAVSIYQDGALTCTLPPQEYSDSCATLTESTPTVVKVVGPDGAEDTVRLTGNEGALAFDILDGPRFAPYGTYASTH